jgi:general secretion pathway protein E
LLPAPLSPREIPPLPFTFARRHGLILEGEAGTFRLYCRTGVEFSSLLEVRRAFGQPFDLIEVTPEEFDRLLQQTYERGGTTQRVVDGIEGDLDLSQLAHQLNEPADLLEHADDAPIIRLINALIAEAIRERASDIHIEPFEGRLAVRLRIDGVLRKILEPPRAIAPLLVSRVKVMAKLDIAEKRLPQDGRISVRIANRPVDVRVSTMPCGHGERVVLRLLDKQAGRLRLEEIGMDERTCGVLDELIRRPHGILLVTGPTGSGKTTTLYAALLRLNDATRNIMTVEDPIEYYIDGIAQSQVNTRIEMSFARGLRAMLRQDPDVVMVGEIRDLETAQIAVQASLTGHLVLSTLHTNTAVGAVTRLRDMGVEPFLLASSVVGVLAQRLVRVLCNHCKRTLEVPTPETEWLGIAQPATGRVFRPAGCPSCNHTGYRGRTSIYELVAVDDGLRRLVHDGAGEHDLEAHARGSSPSLRTSGRDKVLAGITAAEEVMRVIRDA